MHYYNINQKKLTQNKQKSLKEKDYPIKKMYNIKYRYLMIKRKEIVYEKYRFQKFFRRIKYKIY